MLTEMVEYGHKIEEKAKPMQSEMKENVQGTNSDQDPNQRCRPEDERNIWPEQNEETRIQKNEGRLRNLWDNIKHTNIWTIGMPEGEEEQEIENLFERIMKENFPNLAKEIDIQVQ